MNYNQLILLFITLTGCIIGLGAVTVIDIHGFLGRKSPYWTQATIRTHKVTKPLIWIGTMLATVGSVLFYWKDGLTSMHIIQLVIAIILVVNGCFLSFWLSPRLLKREKEGRDKEILPLSWQKAITGSFLISFFGWWTEIFLLCWYLIEKLSK